MNKFVCTAAIAAGAVVASSATADMVGIVGGQTNVTLDGASVNDTHALFRALIDTDVTEKLKPAKAM